MATVSAPTSEDRRAQVLRSSRIGRNSLGEMLRRARELRGLTLERIARDTKIPQRHLEAFERDNLTAVPSGFYQRAELRTYAQAVGLDQRLALAELESALAPQETREPRQTRGSSNKASISPLPYIAIAVVAIGVAGALFGRANVESRPQLSPAVGTGVAGEPTPVVSPPEQATETLLPEPSAGALVARDPAIAPPAQIVTELVVSTQPEGARVTVNGIGWGTSPARIQYLEPGEKRIRVSKEGYVAVERVLQLDEGRRQALDIPLERLQ